MTYTREQREAKKLQQQPETHVEQERKEHPKYRITDKCYLNDILYDPENMPTNPNYDPNRDPAEEAFKPIIITWDKKPEYYMEPVNEAARQMCIKYPRSDKVIAIDELTNFTNQAA